MIIVDPGDDRVGIRGCDRPEDGIKLFLLPCVAFGRLGRSDVEQERQSSDLPEELKELGLTAPIP